MRDTVLEQYLAKMGFLRDDYLGGIYKEYKPIDEHYVWQRTRRMRWLGPTKVGVHLVWLLGRGNKNA